MAMLDETFHIPKQKHSGLFISITTTGITFSKDVVETLGTPEFVTPYVSEVNKQFAIVANGNEPGARSFCKIEVGARSTLIRWGDRGLRRQLLAMTKVDPDGKSLRVYGTFHPEEKLILFDLMDTDLSSS